MNKLLTKEENDVMDALVEAWNLFVKLPHFHPDEFNEFKDAIHKAQVLIMARPVQIEYNKQKDNQ